MATILHVVTTLSGGGAEAALGRLILSDNTNVHHVIGLAPGDAPELRERGVAVQSLKMRRRTVPVGAVLRLARLIRELKPDVVQTWLYHADLVGGIAARLANHSTVVWGIHNANVDRSLIGMRTSLVARACALLSHSIPDRVVSCSEAAARLHAGNGYASGKFRVIPNGYDVDRFSRDAAGRARVRAEWKIDDRTLLFGMVARWDPQKDHRNLAAALAHMSSFSESNWRCALIGRGMNADNPLLLEILEKYGVRERVLLCGPRNDMPAVFSALDVHVLASRSEAFPNVLAEAMACGTPCIATNVGDARMIIGDAGWIVPRNHPETLGRAMHSASIAFSDAAHWGERQALGRSRIAKEFSLARMVGSYSELWASAAQNSRSEGRSSKAGAAMST